MRSHHVLLEYWLCDVVTLSDESVLRDALVEALVKVNLESSADAFQSHDDGVSGCFVGAGWHLSVETSVRNQYACVDFFASAKVPAVRSHESLYRSLGACGFSGITLERGSGREIRTISGM